MRIRTVHFTALALLIAASAAAADEALAAIIRDARVEIYVLYCDGAPAGYAELDFRKKGEVELAYFGLIPEYIGRGLGGYMLDWAIDTAWSRRPGRVWVHTCTLDHPAALAVYQKAGFVAYDQETVTIPDPGAGMPSTPRDVHGH